MTREKVIQELVDDYVNKVIEDYMWNDTSYISYVFEQEGFKPFNSYTNEELESEYCECFNKKIRINLVD